VRATRQFRWLRYACALVAAHVAAAEVAPAGVGASAGASALYHEQFRPQLHFSPATQWMNDPNGLVYLDGEYHLFYQFHPFSNRWGPMHWGHAISRDLVHWEQQPIALAPDEHGAIFSGSAVYDRDNTSGLGTAAHPPLVAVFTYHNHDLEKRHAIDVESQGMAYSIDRGRSWTKYAGNPLLTNPGIRDFRDPKVFWHARSHRWIMTLATRDQVRFYSSGDLKIWRYESAFGRGLGAHGGVWECPDLFEMKVAGNSGGPEASRFVLLVSVNPGAVNGGSGTQYFVGRFDGHRFSLDETFALRLKGGAVWLDYGTDDYAGVTWSGVPASDGRTLFLGWMSNWSYAQDVPTERWRSAMTLPRELKLVRAARGLELHAAPVAELAALRQRHAALVPREILAPEELVAPELHTAGLFELQLDLKLNDAMLVSLTFSNAQGEETVLRINRTLHRYELDRSRSGVVDFNAGFGGLQTAPIIGSGDSVALRVFADQASLEVFINDGETVLTSLVFPHTAYNSAVLGTDRAIALEAGALYELNSIWPR
jgi:fructan beta-fructosidase